MFTSSPSFRSASLRSRGCFLVVNGNDNKLYLWQGFKACKATAERAQQAAQNLKTSILDLHKKSLDIDEIVEGEENDAFWDTLGDEEDYMSYIEGRNLIFFQKKSFSFSFENSVIIFNIFFYDALKKIPFRI